MNRALLFFSFPIALGALGSALACSSSPDLFLRGVLAPPAGASPTSCVFSTDPAQQTLSKGIFDVEVVSSFSDTYEAAFLAGNQTSSPIAFQSAAVTITDASGASLSTFTSKGRGSVGVGSGGATGYGELQITLVDSQTVDRLRGELGFLERMTILTTTVVTGQAPGGQTVTTNTFEFPITACKGCLIDFASDSTVAPQPNCQGKATPTGMAPGVCFYGEDVPTDCHACLADPYCRCGAAAAMDPTCFGEGGLEGGADGGAGG